jgi:hypothetical protein
MQHVQLQEKAVLGLRPEVGPGDQTEPGTLPVAWQIAEGAKLFAQRRLGHDCTFACHQGGGVGGCHRSNAMER